MRRPVYLPFFRGIILNPTVYCSVEKLRLVGVLFLPIYWILRLEILDIPTVQGGDRAGENQPDVGDASGQPDAGRAGQLEQSSCRIVDRAGTGGRPGGG